MKRIYLLSILLITAVAMSACSAAAPAADFPGRTLSVSGSGKVTTTPDKVTISIGVQTQGDDVARAVAENNRLASAVQDAVVAAGVSPADVQSSYFSVWNSPIYDPSGSPTGEVTYYVDNTLTATMRDPSKLGAMLQAALNAGANNIQGISFGVSETKAFEDEARQKAMQDAVARAQMMATAAGIRLGKLTSISTSVSYPQQIPYYAYSQGMGGGGGGEPSISSGSAEIQASVNLVYEIIP
jgi:uncharacterized protein YggE